MSTLTWLHLSDLHACSPKFGWDADRVTETLVRDLERLRDDHGLAPDLLFFTGDAAFGEIGTEPGQTVRGQLECCSPRAPARETGIYSSRWTVSGENAGRHTATYLAPSGVE